mmetsp:Transcript_10728/g.23261  ORF Transcript_10728/g.23261 Transcript_10728/m.23261 type:complete len:235 (-) Transcript_10728:1829-2533(-)
MDSRTGRHVLSSIIRVMVRSSSPTRRLEVVTVDRAKRHSRLVTPAPKTMQMMQLNPMTVVRITFLQEMLNLKAMLLLMIVFQPVEQLALVTILDQNKSSETVVLSNQQDHQQSKLGPLPLLRPLSPHPLLLPRNHRPFLLRILRKNQLRQSQRPSLPLSRRAFPRMRRQQNLPFNATWMRSSVILLSWPNLRLYPTQLICEERQRLRARQLIGLCLRILRTYVQTTYILSSGTS